jgi:hypothetical protein
MAVAHCASARELVADDEGSDVLPRSRCTGWTWGKWLARQRQAVQDGLILERIGVMPLAVETLRVR